MAVSSIGSRIDHRLPDRHGVFAGPMLEDTVAVANLIHDRQGKQISLDSLLKIEVVVKLVYGRSVRESGLKAQGSKPRLNGVRNCDPGRSGRPELVGLFLCASGS